jgi:hypothetical protein
MAFEFFLATCGAEVVCLSLKIYPEFCCFFIKHSTTHIISQLTTQHSLMKIQYKNRMVLAIPGKCGDGTIL